MDEIELEAQPDLALLGEEEYIFFDAKVNKRKTILPVSSPFCVIDYPQQQDFESMR